MGMDLSPWILGQIVPELPNFITLLYRRFQGYPWADFLHHWENVIFAIIVAIVVSVLFHLGVRKRELIPKGVQNFLELVVETLSQIITGILGHDGKKYIPFLGTLFIYILSMNLFGLIPLMKSPSASLNITVALAICVFCLVQYLNIRNMGIKGFLWHMAGSPKDTVGWVMTPFMFPLELLTQFSRPVTLSLRLFGNIMGEEALIGYFALAGVALLSYFPLTTPVGLPLQIPFMFLALLTSLMQALVFTLLSTVYILLSIPHEEGKHSH
jgi:F-type H+-transporting ATPase subunit a